MRVLIIILSLTSFTACQTSPELENIMQVKSTEALMTDGTGLRPKPAPLSKELQDALFKDGNESCAVNCATEFGTLLGTADQIPAYSNCQSSCIQPEYSFLNLTDKSVTNYSADPADPNQHYIGVIYQCVEYARRWWMSNQGVTFGSVDSAHEIIYLTEAKNIYNNNTLPLARSINGTATRAPTRGDLVIYYPQEGNPNWRYGHVAVIVDVDLEQGTVSLAEENYSNQRWENPAKYARKIQLKNIQGKYHLLDIAPNGEAYNDGEISGWIYPHTQ